MRYLLILLGIFGADRELKEYTNNRRLQGEEKQLFGGKVILRNYHNPGAAFGFLKDYPKLNKGLSVFVLSGVLWDLLRTLLKEGHTLRKLGLSLIAGGGANNCLERLETGYVTDYVSFDVKPKRMRKVVFNLSDFAVFSGLFFYLLSSAGSLCGDFLKRRFVRKKTGKE